MWTPLQEQAIALYREGKTLREVAASVQRSHEWVRQLLRKAEESVRNRGRVGEEHAKCALCNERCDKSSSRYCSRRCMQVHQYKTAAAKLEPALRVLRGGGTYAEAAEAAGFKSAWHLWGRMHHFQLTDQFQRLKRPKKPESV